MVQNIVDWFFSSHCLNMMLACAAQVVDPTALDADDDDDAEDEEHFEDMDEDEEVEGLVMGGSDSRAAAAARAAVMRKERDGEMMELLVKQVVPRAVHLYFNGPMQVRSGLRLSTDPRCE